MSKLGGKQGNAKKKIIRGNILGKPVKRTTRAVISNNPFLDIDRVMVDTKVAKGIRMQEVVTTLNIDKVRDIIARESKTDNQTITRIFRGNGSFLVSGDTVPMVGDIYERDLQDGDYVSYNRSPSLLPTYMAGFRVLITTENVDAI